MKDLGKKARVATQPVTQTTARAARRPAVERALPPEGQLAPSGLPEADKVSFFSIADDDAGQRLDNYLFKLAKGVPKSHVYRIIRAGEVRINRKRVDATYRIEAGDELRVPPLRVAQRQSKTPVRAASFPVLFEDEHLLIIDKPAGVAVHGGSGVSFGVIEQLRAHGALTQPHGAFLELVHRLDRDTSGVLMLAKKRAALVAVQDDMREGRLDKRYLVLVAGDWINTRQHVRLPLEKYLINDGERRVRVAEGGLAAHTVFSLRERFGAFSLLEAELKTGRTHQIRVHLAHLGFPIVGDDKYGDRPDARAAARIAQSLGFKRMFLHAWRLALTHPATGEPLVVEAPLPPVCSQFMEALRHAPTI